MKYSLYVLFCVASLSFADSPSPRFTVTDKIAFQQMSTDLGALQKIAQNTLSFIETYKDRDWFAPVKKSLLEKHSVTLEKVQETLSFIVWVIKHDKGKSKQRMLDQEFLRKHFTFLQWHPDVKRAEERKVSYVDDNNIRITKYLVFEVKGSYKKTKDFPCALYATTEKDQHLIKKYTKQDVVAGALDKVKKFKPLVWLARDDLEEALMQGTVYVTMPDNKMRVFNVEYNNGIAYEQKLKDKKLQKRYWTFKEVDGFLGWGIDSKSKIQIVPGVTFAGDVYSLGLGQVIAIQYRDAQTGISSLRIGVLADTGGAFQDNLYQLDFFTGVFPSREKFEEGTKNIPTAAQAFVVVKKS